MNKQEFIDEVCAKTNLSTKDAKASVEAVLDVITETLSKGESVNFTGFGSFATNIRAAREARVPGTNKTVQVPEIRVAKFKAGLTLKNSIRN